ncbi:MAG: hypothetical protein K2I69_06225 [Muribaculaceae bacterium]|nr:hypothetical protein [Muribaculaceae bacterium]
MAPEEMTSQSNATYKTGEWRQNETTPQRTVVYGAIHQAKYQHEEITQQTQNEHEERMADKEYSHRKEMLDKELGRLGHLFGSRSHSARTIAFVIVISVLLISTAILACVYFCAPANSECKQFELIWTNTIPVVTLTLGYLFGSGSNQQNN